MLKTRGQQNPALNAKHRERNENGQVRQAGKKKTKTKANLIKIADVAPATIRINEAMQH